MLDSVAVAAFGSRYRERLLQLTFVAICPHHPTLLAPFHQSFLCEWDLRADRNVVADDEVQDFSTFSFDHSATSTMSYQACDPLDQQNVFEVYTPDSQESVVSTSEMFSPGCLTIDTSFMDSWTASSSPLSSVPGTPQTYSAVQTPCDPTSVLDNYLPPLADVYDPSAEYLPQHQHPHGTQLYASGVPAYCAPTDIDMSYGTQDFGSGSPKGDFAFYGRSALEPMNNAAAFPPSYLSTFAI